MPVRSPHGTRRRHRDRGHRRGLRGLASRPIGSGPTSWPAPTPRARSRPIAGSIDPAEALDPRIAQPDHVYTTRGGFVGPIRFDPAGTALDPALVERLDPVFHLALVAAGQAWRDAETEAVDRRRAGVVFGNIVLPTETASALSLDLLGRRSRSGSASRAEPPGSVRAAQRVPGRAARRRSSPRPSAWEASRTRWTPPVRSSLYALKLAVDELRSGRADAMIAGGVSRPDALYTQMGFSQLRALSPRGKAAPLDRPRRRPHRRRGRRDVRPQAAGRCHRAWGSDLRRHRRHRPVERRRTAT